MKRFGKILTVTCVAALALAVVSASGASAATFTASATGTLKGAQENTQVFTPGSFGSVECKLASVSGPIESTEALTQKANVKYTECTAFGAKATVSEAHYLFHANGEVDVLSSVVIEVPSLFCKNTVPAQSGLKSVTYKNLEGGKITVEANVTGIKSEGSGTCAGGTSGTYRGNTIVERAEGGTVSVDTP